MRTTVDLDEDLLRTAKQLARENELSLGQVISDLMRRGLKPEPATYQLRNGVPVLEFKTGAPQITSEMVKELLELDQ